MHCSLRIGDAMWCNKISRLNAYLNKSKMCERMKLWAEIAQDASESTGNSALAKVVALGLRFIETHSIKWLNIYKARVSKFLLICSRNRKVVCVWHTVKDTFVFVRNQNEQRQQLCFHFFCFSFFSLLQSNPIKIFICQWDSKNNSKLKTVTILLSGGLHSKIFEIKTGKHMSVYHIYFISFGWTKRYLATRVNSKVAMRESQRSSFT